MTAVALIGPPGSGKGTQAEILFAKTGWPQISTGNILRHAVEQKTDLGLKVKDCLERGELVNDEIVEAIIHERLRGGDCKAGFILDGYPRDLSQAKELESTAKIELAVYIRVPDEVIVKRISARRVCDCGRTYHIESKPPAKAGMCDACGRVLHQRDDDREETVKRRLQVYHGQTEPVLAYYAGQGVLVELDGMKPINQISGAIISQLARI